MIPSKIKRRINDKLSIFGNGVDEYLQTNSNVTVSGDFSIVFNDLRLVTQTNQIIFSIGSSNAEFFTIRTGLSGAVSPYGVQITSGGSTIDALSQLAQFSNYENQDWLNRRTQVVVNIDQTNNNIELYINGGLAWVHNDVNLSGISFTAPARVFTFHGLTNHYEGAIDNLAILDRLLTVNEIKVHNLNGGVLPKSTHLNIVNHWSLTQNYYYDDNGTIKAWDVVEQYNYAKVTPLSPNQFNLQGYTLAEVGADEPANQNKIYNTKNKQLASEWGLKFNGVDQSAILSPLTNSYSLGNGDFAVFLDFYYLGITGEDYVFDAFPGGAGTYIRIILLSSSVISFAVQETTTTGAINEYIVNFEAGKRYRLIFVKSTNDNNNWYCLSNGQKVAKVVKTNTLAGGINIDITSIKLCARNQAGGETQQANVIINDLHFYNNIPENITNLWQLNETQTGLVERINPGKRSDTSVNTFAGNTLVLQNFTLADYHLYYVIKQSGLTEIVNCLDMNGDNRSVSIPSLQSSSLELTIFNRTEIFSISDLLSFGTAPTITAYYFNGVKLSNEADLIAAINTYSICQINLIYDQLTTTITINDFSGYVMQFALNWYNEEFVKESLTSIIRNFNNSIFFPEVAFRTNYYLFNSETDGIDQIGSSNATLNNFTASEVVLINEVRGLGEATLAGLTAYATYGYELTNRLNNIYSDAGKTTVSLDKIKALKIEAVAGGVDMDFIGNDFATLIPGVRTSQASYWKKNYKGIFINNSQNQLYDLNSSFASNQVATYIRVVRILPSPNDEKLTFGTGAFNIEVEGGTDHYRVSVGGGEIYDMPSGVGYPDGVGDNGDLLNLMIDIITKNGTSWNYYRYNSLTRALIDSWTTTANNALTQIGEGSNGHAQNQILHWSSILPGTILTQSDMDEVAKIVNAWQRLGSPIFNIPQPTISLVFDDVLDNFDFTVNVKNPEIKHNLNIQLFHAGNAGAPSLNATVLIAGATKQYNNNTNAVVTGSFNHEEIGAPFDDQYINNVTYNNVTNTFTVNGAQSGTQILVQNTADSDVILFPTAGNYPSGMSRQRYFVINLTGDGLSDGDTFQLSETQAGPPVTAFADNGGTMSIVRQSRYWLIGGVESDRVDNGEESMELSSGHPLRDNVD